MRKADRRRRAGKKGGPVREHRAAGLQGEANRGQKPLIIRRIPKQAAQNPAHLPPIPPRWTPTWRGYPYLLDCFELAQEGEPHVITRYRAKNQNLRTQFERIIKRAGLSGWPRLFHNLRASRQTELEQDFPGYVVAKWIGNSESVARKHYLMLTEDHFQRAAWKDEKAAQNPAQQSAAEGCTAPQSDMPFGAEPAICGALRIKTAPCETHGAASIPPRGVEPLSPG